MELRSGAIYLAAALFDGCNKKLKIRNSRDSSIVIRLRSPYNLVFLVSLVYLVFLVLNLFRYSDFGFKLTYLRPAEAGRYR